MIEGEGNYQFCQLPLPFHSGTHPSLQLSHPSYFSSFGPQGFSHNLMHVFCFAIYVCGYPYLAYLYSKRKEWLDGDTWGLGVSTSGLR